jgi:hypothetical protein
MSRYERSGIRDLGFSQWHRERFDDDAKAYDVDLVGLCHRCDQPQYVIETTRSAGFKPTKWTARVALMLNVPGYLVHYVNDDDGRLAALTAHLLAPFCSRRLIGGSDAFELHLKALRATHAELWHGMSQPAPEQSLLFVNPAVWP